jgi:hypothetical protein
LPLAFRPGFETPALLSFLTEAEHYRHMGALGRFRAVRFFQIPAEARADGEGVPLLYFRLDSYVRIDPLSQLRDVVSCFTIPGDTANDSAVTASAASGSATDAADDAAADDAAEAAETSAGPTKAAREESDNDDQLKRFASIVGSLPAQELERAYRAVLAADPPSRSDLDWAWLFFANEDAVTQALLNKTRGLLNERAQSHGRSFMGAFYSALGALSTPDLAQELLEAQDLLFRINGAAGLYHRTEGRGFRFGNEVTLVRSDLEPGAQNQHCPSAPSHSGSEKFSLD